MIDYKKIADILQANSTENQELTKEAFENLTKERNLKFIQEIDKPTPSSSREIWGNSNFWIIVLHTNKNYQIL